MIEKLKILWNNLFTSREEAVKDILKEIRISHTMHSETQNHLYEQDTDISNIHTNLAMKLDTLDAESMKLLNDIMARLYNDHSETTESLRSLVYNLNRTYNDTNSNINQLENKLDVYFEDLHKDMNYISNTFDEKEMKETNRAINNFKENVNSLAESYKKEVRALREKLIDFEDYRIANISVDDFLKYVIYTSTEDLWKNMKVIIVDEGQLSAGSMKPTVSNINYELRSN